MSHKNRHQKQPPTATPSLPIVYGSIRVPGYVVSPREQLWLYAIVLIASAAAVIAIFAAGYVTGAALVAHG
jgi:hypothetical protein